MRSTLNIAQSGPSTATSCRNCSATQGIASYHHILRCFMEMLCCDSLESFHSHEHCLSVILHVTGKEEDEMQEISRFIFCTQALTERFLYLFAAQTCFMAFQKAKRLSCSCSCSFSLLSLPPSLTPSFTYKLAHAGLLKSCSAIQFNSINCHNLQQGSKRPIPTDTQAAKRYGSTSMFQGVTYTEDLLLSLASWQWLACRRQKAAVTR